LPLGDIFIPGKHLYSARGHMEVAVFRRILKTKACFMAIAAPLHLGESVWGYSLPICDWLHWSTFRGVPIWWIDTCQPSMYVPWLL